MSNYHMTMSGINTLSMLQQAIRGEEALRCRFIKNQLSAVDGTITNLVTFEEVDAIPTDVKLTAHGTAVPPGTTLIWSGVMLVGGSNLVIDVYRAQST